MDVTYKSLLVNPRDKPKPSGAMADATITAVPRYSPQLELPCVHRHSTYAAPRDHAAYLNRSDRGKVSPFASQAPYADGHKGSGAAGAFADTLSELCRA